MTFAIILGTLFITIFFPGYILQNWLFPKISDWLERFSIAAILGIIFTGITSFILLKTGLGLRVENFLFILFILSLIFIIQKLVSHQGLQFHFRNLSSKTLKTFIWPAILMTLMGLAGFGVGLLSPVQDLSPVVEFHFSPSFIDQTSADQVRVLSTLPVEIHNLEKFSDNYWIKLFVDQKLVWEKKDLPVAADQVTQVNIPMPVDPEEKHIIEIKLFNSANLLEDEPLAKLVYWTGPSK